jgi:hypothetical protein
MRVIFCVMMASYEEHSAFKPIMHKHDNLEGIRGELWAEPMISYQANLLS